MTFRRWAHHLFLKHRIGSLESAKDADIAVWDRDPPSVSTDDLTHRMCELTLVRGRGVYYKANSPISGVSSNES